MEVKHNTNKKKPIVNVTTMYGKIVIYDNEPEDKDKKGELKWFQYMIL